MLLWINDKSPPPPSLPPHTHTHTHTHTHHYACDLQSAILHQGQSWFISLQSLSIFLPWNLDWRSSDYTAVQLRRRTPRYGLIGRTLANDRRHTTWRAWRWEGRVKAYVRCVISLLVSKRKVKINLFWRVESAKGENIFRCSVGRIK